MENKLDVIFKNDNDELVTRTCTLTDNDTVRWEVILKKENSSRLAICFLGKDGLPSVHGFINSLVINDGIKNLNTIDKIILTLDDKENIIDGNDIESIVNVNSDTHIVTEITLYELKNYPGLLTVNTQNLVPAEPGQD